METDQAKLILQKINTAMQFQEGLDGRHLKWFYCFGTMEEYVADLTFGLKFDIDIGVIGEDCNAEALLRSFEGYGYELSSVFRSDVDGMPLNMHFKPVEEAIEGTPHIDMYVWVRQGNMLYHTYDIHRTGLEVPTRYTFKGVKREWMVPDRRLVDRIRASGPEMPQQLTQDGIWSYDVFEQHSGYKIYIPFAYGTLLDCWDPGWRFRDFKRGSSKTMWLREVKSCKEML